MTVLKIASFNIYKKLSDAKTVSDFKNLLGIEGIDLAGLQEIDWGIDDELPGNWKVVQAKASYARKDPIVYHVTLGDPDFFNHYKIIPRIDEGRGNTPARAATVAVWKGLLIHINFHLNADVEGQPPGHPNKNRTRVRGNYSGMQEVIEIADEMQRRYHVPVVLTADFNVDYEADKRVRNFYFPYCVLTRAGFKCCWDHPNKAESTRRKKPHKGRTIDHVWARGTKTHRVVFRNAFTPNRWGPDNPVNSDHLAVITTVKIKKRTFPWLFNWLGKRIKRR